MAVSFNSYYLYKKYEKRGDQPWFPVYPETLSIDGDGSMPKVLKTSGDPACCTCNVFTYSPTSLTVSSAATSVTFSYTGCSKPEISTVFPYNWIAIDSHTYNTQTGEGSIVTNISGNTSLSRNAILKVLVNDNLCQYFSIEQENGEMYRWLETEDVICIEVGAQYRWTPSGTTCVDFKKCQNNIKEISVDSGTTWSVLLPPQYSASTIISYFSDECGYTPFNGKYKITNVNGTVASAACNYSSSLTRNEVSGYSNSAKTVEIGACVTAIGQYAFAGMYEFRNLIAVYIPNSVTKIEKGAFSSSYNLISADIPSGVTSIGGSAYSECYKITEIKIPTGVTRLENHTFAGCHSLTSVTIPNSVTFIGLGTFYDCPNLTSITLPDGLTNIGQDGFAYCGFSSLGPKGSGASIELPSGVTNLSDAAFAYNSFSAITIPSTVTSIGNSTFECTSLSSVTIPSGVTSIGNYAFCLSSHLRSLIVESITPPSAGDEILYQSSYCKIYVPASAVNAYKSASGWSTYANRIQAII